MWILMNFTFQGEIWTPGANARRDCIYSNITFIEAQNSIQVLASMVEKAYGLPSKHEDSTVAINLVNAQ